MLKGAPSIRGAGNCSSLTSLLSGAAAARKYTLSSSPKVKVYHDSATDDVVYWAEGADAATAGNRVAFLAPGEALIIDAHGAAYLSFYSASDSLTLYLAEVK